MAPKTKRQIAINNYSPASGDSRASKAESPDLGNALPTTEIKMDLSSDFGAEDNFVENILVSRIIPDPIQPRPSPLPRSVLNKYQKGEITSFQAVEQWTKLSEKHPEIRHTYLKYIAMGEDLVTKGQINPITCSRVIVQIKGKKEEQYHLETGEQRFWSTLLFHSVSGDTLTDLRIRAIIEPDNRIIDPAKRVNRQISENRRTMGMTEVTQAREIASLMLVLISNKTGQVFEPDAEDEYGYFRAATKLNERVPNGVWDEMKAALGLSRRRMAQSLSVLQLPSDLLDIANRAPLSYRSISEIIQLPESEWKNAIWRAANEMIAADKNEEEAETITVQSTQTSRAAYRPSSKTDDYVLAYRGMKKFVRAIKHSHDEMVIDQVCDEIFADGTKTAEEFISYNKKIIEGLQQRIDSN